MTRNTAAFTAALLLLCLRPLAGQPAEAFSILDVQAAGVLNVDSGELGDLWRSRHGFLVRLATPFYIGTGAIAVQQTGFGGRRPDRPDFRMRTATAEWNVDGQFSRGVRGFAGVHAGSTGMSFLDAEHLSDNTEENEFVAGIQGGASLRLSGGLAATAIASHRKVFTRHPLRLTFLTLGLGYSFATPRALRAFLE
ncbi:MAG: hypothetical protein WD766_02515 [Gemmatimonadota bacterium]